MKEQRIRNPQTLLEAVRYYSDKDAAQTVVVKMRWPDGPVCPRCGGKEYSYLTTRRLWKCKDCKKQYSVRVGTIFKDSPLGFEKWLPAMWLVVNCKNGVSSHELARALGVHQQTAWFMLQRIRLAMRTGSFQKLQGEVEVDESFIGGAARFMHPARRRQKFGGNKSPHGHKTIVMGLRERDGQFRAQVVPDTSADTLQPLVRQFVQPGSAVYTDKANAYRGIDAFDEYEHATVDHAVQYVDGKVHTNGVENFWSLLKRSLKGTYVSVEAYHLFRYLDEQVYRYNNRHYTDGEHFLSVLRRVDGKRLTYKELIGKDAA